MKKQILLAKVLIIISMAVFAQPKASSWDGVAIVISEFLKENAHDPKSIKIAECSYIFEMSDGFYYQRVKYRGKNAFGATVLNEHYFQLKGQGDRATVTSFYTKDEFLRLERQKNFKIVRQYDSNGRQIRQ
jgi:hypothetical protein